MNYGEKIREKREELGLTKWMFAKLSGFDRSNYTNIELGKRSITEDKYKEILVLLKQAKKKYKKSKANT